jgi:threonine dehydrogenase-like Zn-dependent dehydrogenase
MLQLTFVEAGKAEWRDVAEPELQEPTDALVRPVAIATCDLDGAVAAGAAPGIGPYPLGHEFVAEVLETGEAVDGAPEAGALVQVPFQVSCGECEPCRAGRTGNCANLPARSTYGLGPFGNDFGGALTDLVRVPFAQHMLVPLPAGISPEAVASVSDNVPDAWRTVAGPLEQRPGAEVLVVGGVTRSIALYAVDIALALGASAVHYVDDDDERLRVAESLGAKVHEGEIPKRMGPFPITVSGSGTHEGLHLAIRSTEGDGVCTSVGIFFELETPMPLLEMYTTNVTFVTGRCHARPAIPKILDLVAEGRLHPEKVTSDVVPWDAAPEAFSRWRTKQVVVRD